MGSNSSICSYIMFYELANFLGSNPSKNTCKGWEGADEQVTCIHIMRIWCHYSAFWINWTERPGQSTTPEQSQEGQGARAWSWFVIEARWPQRENRRFWGGGASSKHKDLLLLVWAFLDFSLTVLFHYEEKVDWNLVPIVSNLVAAGNN